MAETNLQRSDVPGAESEHGLMWRRGRIRVGGARLGPRREREYGLAHALPPTTSSGSSSPPTSSARSPSPPTSTSSAGPNSFPTPRPPPPSSTASYTTATSSRSTVRATAFGSPPCRHTRMIDFEPFQRRHPIRPVKLSRGVKTTTASEARTATAIQRIAAPRR